MNSSIPSLHCNNNRDGLWKTFVHHCHRDLNGETIALIKQVPSLSSAPFLAVRKASSFIHLAKGGNKRQISNTDMLAAFVAPASVALRTVQLIIDSPCRHLIGLIPHNVLDFHWNMGPFQRISIYRQTIHCPPSHSSMTWQDSCRALGGLHLSVIKSRRNKSSWKYTLTSEVRYKTSIEP